MFQKGPLFPTLDEVVDHFRTTWEQKKIAPSSKEMTGMAAEDVYYKEGIALLEKFYKTNAPWNFNVVDLESRFEFEAIDPKTGEKHIISGSIDRVDKNADGSIEIIDYKTKRRMASQKDIDDDLQLSIYQLGLVKKWPHFEGNAIKLTLYFLKHGEKISSQRTGRQLDEVRQSVLETIREIETRTKNDDFPPSPSGLCDWCEYKQMCPMWRHMYKRQYEAEKIKNQEELNQYVGEYFRLKDQNSKNTGRLNQLKTFIFAFMDEQKVERVFGDEGYLTRTMKDKNNFDLDKIKEILEPIGKWQDILEPDEKKLEKLLPRLSDELREKILALAKKKKEVRLNMKKKVTLDEEDEEDENGE